MKLNFKIGYLLIGIERPRVTGGVAFRFLLVIRGRRYMRYMRKVKEMQRRSGREHFELSRIDAAFVWINKILGG